MCKYPCSQPSLLSLVYLYIRHDLSVNISSHNLSSTHRSIPPSRWLNISISTLTFNISITCSSLLHCRSTPSSSQTSWPNILTAFFRSRLLSLSNPSMPSSTSSEVAVFHARRSRSPDLTPSQRIVGHRRFAFSWAKLIEPCL